MDGILSVKIYHLLVLLIDQQFTKRNIMYDSVWFFSGSLVMPEQADAHSVTLIS